LHRAFQAAASRFREQIPGSPLRLSWELFDDPHGTGKLVVVRFLDPGAADGLCLVGKLTASLRPRPDGGTLLDCTGPFHGVHLRAPFQRHGLVSALLREVLLPTLPPPAGVLAAAGPGTAAGVALEFFRAYMVQRRGAEWLASDSGRSWWRSLPDSRQLDWDAAGGYPPLFALLQAAGLRLRLDERACVLALPRDTWHPGT
jgi:hypothetical protein